VRSFNPIFNDSVTTRRRREFRFSVGADGDSEIVLLFEFAGQPEVPGITVAGRRAGSAAVVARDDNLSGSFGNDILVRSGRG
jgi:hypothetical protein